MANWLSGHTRAAFLLLAFVGCGEAFRGGGNEGGEGGEPASESGGTSGTAGAGGGASGGVSGAGATGGQGGNAGSVIGNGGASGASATGGDSGAGAQAGESGSEAGQSNAGNPGTGGSGEGGSENEGGRPPIAGSAGVAGTAGVAGVAGTGGVVIQPEPPKDGLVLWLRADAGVTVTDDGDVVSWADQSEHGRLVEQTGSDERPSLVSRGQGALARVEFDGVDDFMRIPDGFSDFSEGLSAFAVTNARSLDACWAVFELSNGSEIDDIFFGHYDTSPHYEVADVWFTEGEYPVGDDFLLSVIHDKDAFVETRTNGSVVGEHTVPLPEVIERTQNLLGRTQYANCGVMEGSISEFLLYERAVSSEELLAIEDYLETRWDCCE